MNLLRPVGAFYAPSFGSLVRLWGSGGAAGISRSVELPALCGIAPLLKVHNILSFLTAPKIVNLIDSNRGVALAHN
jgi:hypothetical protein